MLRLAFQSDALPTELYPRCPLGYNPQEPTNEITDLNPGSSLGAIVPEGALAIEDFVVGVDAPHSGPAVGDLLQTAIDLLPEAAVHVAAGDALAVEDFIVGVDSPHETSGTDCDVFQFPVGVHPSRTRGPEGRARKGGGGKKKKGEKKKKKRRKKKKKEKKKKKKKRREREKKKKKKKKKKREKKKGRKKRP